MNASPSLRVVTWNIRLGVESSLARIAERLSMMDPDLVALQEVGRHWVMGEPGDQAAVLARGVDLPHHHFFPALWTRPCRDLHGLAGRLWPLGEDGEPNRAGLSPDEPLPRYGVAVLSRFPLSALRRVPLPRTRDEPRVCGVVRVDAPGGALRLLVTHLSVRKEERRRQAVSIRRILRESRDPTVLLGDLNDEIDAPALHPLARTLDDAAGRAGDDRGKTYPSDEPTRRIDFVLTSEDWRAVAPARPVSSRASDHLPVLAVIERRTLGR